MPSNSRTSSLEKHGHQVGGQVSSVRKQLSQDCETIFAHVQKNKLKKLEENKIKTRNMNENIKISRSNSKDRSISPYTQGKHQQRMGGVDKTNLLKSFNHAPVYSNTLKMTR